MWSVGGRPRFVGVSFCALLLAGCITNPDHGSALSDRQLEEASYTVDMASQDVDALGHHIKNAGTNKLSAPFVVDGMRAMLDEDYVEANRHFQRALKLDPQNSYLHMLNSLAYQLRGEAGDPEQFELAEVGYKLAAGMDPGFSLVPYFQGVMKFRQQNFFEAREHFARAVTLDPDNVAFLTGLASTAYYLGEMDVAQTVVKRARYLAPDDPEVLRTHSIVSAAIGDFNAARASQNDLIGVSNTRYRYVGSRIDDWERYYTSNDLMADPQVAQMLAQNFDPFGVPDGGMFDSQTGNNEDPVITGDDLKKATTDVTDPNFVPDTPSTTASTTNSNAATTGTSGTAPATSPPSATPAPITSVTTVKPASGFSTGTEPATNTVGASASGAIPVAQAPKVPLPRMALIDVAIIRTEEIYRSGKGVNLLNGLNLFFSGNSVLEFKTPGGLGHIRTAQTTNDVITLQLGTAGAGLTYSLNIFNDNYDRNEVIARPTILVEDQKKSSFFSGGTLHIALEGGVAGSGAIQPINTGVNLEVTPQFLDEDTIDMSVFAQRIFLESSLSQVSDTITGTSFASTSKTSITANLTLRYGETMVLSGLSDQENEKLDDKTPGLGDLPVIQYLFRRQTETSAKKTVLILLTPRRATLNYEEQARDTTELQAQLSDPNLKRLTRSAAWMKPAPHLKALVNHLSKYEYFNHFRAGDMRLENWAGEGTVLDAIKRTLRYLYIYYDFEKNEEPSLK